jgi:DNA excision repair protein ERCC-2
LIGAVVVGVGVPQVCLENDLIKEYFDGQNGSGFAYAYQNPGLNRVLQATGRVIRTETDRGIIVLIDERFTHTRYRQLFPTHWRGFQAVQDTGEIKEKLARFWLRE